LLSGRSERNEYILKPWRNWLHPFQAKLWWDEQLPDFGGGGSNILHNRMKAVSEDRGILDFGRILQ
jgi:hypothetical protein